MRKFIVVGKHPHAGEVVTFVSGRGIKVGDVKMELFEAVKPITARQFYAEPDNIKRLEIEEDA